MIKKCGYCNVEYKTYKSNSKFCSRECSSNNQQTKVEKNCLVCNRLFLHHNYEKNRKYCSMECKQVAENYHVRDIATCKQCGCEFQKRPNKKRTFCSVACKNKSMEKGIRKYSKKDIEDILLKHYGDEYELSSDYTKVLDKITIHHKKCGRKYEATGAQIIHKKTQCKICFNENQKKTEATFKEQLHSIYNGAVILVSPFISNTDLVEVKYLECGHVVEKVAKAALKGKKCAKCTKTTLKYRKTTDDFRDELESKFPKRYEVKSDYRTNVTKVDVIDLNCGHSFSITPSNILKGRGCPYCKESVGEKKVRYTLNEMGVEFKEQFSIDGCKDKRLLKFDFAIFVDGELMLLVEYQGRQHYEIGSKYHSDDIIKRDNIKRSFCKEHNIPLLEIKYTNRKIKETITKHLTMAISSQAERKQSEGLTTR